MHHVCRKCKEVKEIGPSRSRKADWICGRCAWAQRAPRRRVASPKPVRPPRKSGTKEYERLKTQRRMEKPIERERARIRSATRAAVKAGHLARLPCEVC